MHIERRIFRGDVNFEERSGGKRYLSGYALVFNQQSRDLGGFIEVISPQALKNTDLSDVHALFNHDNNHVLGRTTSGTLELNTDNKGLFYRINLPNTSTADMLIELTRRGDINESSFAFFLAEDGDTWEYKKLKLRTLNNIASVRDVSPVTYAAYPDTTAALRSMENFQEEEYNEIEILRLKLNLK